MLSDEDKKRKLENYRKRKLQLSEQVNKIKEEKQKMLDKIKIQRQKIKKSEDKQKEIRDAKDLELVKFLREVQGEEDVDHLFLDVLGIDKKDISLEEEERSDE